MIDEKPKYFCHVHGEHCVKIDHLEANVELRRAEIKDARKSLTIDMEKLARQVKDDYVTKAEFDNVRRMVYGMTAVVVAWAIRSVLV